MQNIRNSHVLEVFKEFVKMNPVCIDSKGKILRFLDLDLCVDAEKIVRLEFEKRINEHSEKSYISNPLWGDV